MIIFFIPANVIKAPKNLLVNSERIIPVELTEMRINYGGDNRNGNGIDELKEEAEVPLRLLIKKRKKISLQKRSKSLKKKLIKIFLTM